MTCFARTISSTSLDKRLRQKLPSLAPAVEQVVLKALGKDPNERFASVQAFAAALEAASKTTDSRSLAGIQVPSSTSLATGLLLRSPAQESSPATQTPALSSPPVAQPSSALLMPADRSARGRPLTDSLPPPPPATSSSPKQPPLDAAHTSLNASMQPSARRRRERAAPEKGTLHYAIGGLIIALLGIWFIAQSSGHSLAVSWMVGGMAIM
jgi:serine/threonine protein kinase